MIPNIQKMGGGGEVAAPHFLHIYYGPFVACTVGYMAYVQLMYGPYMAYV